MKNILITTGIFGPDIGGPASYANTLANWLARHSIKVVVLTYSSRVFCREDQARLFRVSRIWRNLPWGLRHALYFFRAWQLARNADAVYALNAVSAGVPASYAARLAKKPFFVRIAGDYAWEIAVQIGATSYGIDEFQKSVTSGRTGRLSRTQIQTCLKATAIIVPSEYLSNLVQGWGIPKYKILVIANGVDTSGAYISKEEARKKIGISGNIILTAGRFVPWKGFRMLIKIMPELLKLNQFFRLVIVGDGPDCSILEKMIKNLGLGRQVILAGQQSHDMLRVYLAASDIFVLNTGYEGFSHQILEAMAFGVPVITTTAGGNREIITHGVNGFLAEYNDEAQLQDLIEMLWNRDDLRKQISEEGLINAKKFTNELMCEKTYEIINNLTK